MVLKNGGVVLCPPSLYEAKTHGRWLSEGKKNNIIPNGEGGGCKGNQVLNHFCPLAIPEYFS